MVWRRTFNFFHTVHDQCFLLLWTTLSSTFEDGLKTVEENGSIGIIWPNCYLGMHDECRSVRFDIGFAVDWPVHRIVEVMVLRAIAYDSPSSLLFIGSSMTVSRYVDAKPKQTILPLYRWPSTRSCFNKTTYVFILLVQPFSKKQAVFFFL